MTDEVKDSGTTPEAPKPGTPEYDAHMIAKAAGTTIATVDANGNRIEVSDPSVPEQKPVVPPKPDHIPAKFYNAETGEVDYVGMAKSYSELETKLGQPDKKGETAPEKKADGAQPGPALSEVMSTASSEYAKDGKFSEATYEALKAHGVSREYADSYAEGLVARAELTKTKVYAEAGGEQEFATLNQWAAATLSAEQIAAHNAAVTGNDLNTVLGAVRTLKGLYAQANGSPAVTRVSPTGGTTGVTAAHYADKSAMVADMSNPKYHTSPAFRAEVAQKIAASMQLGVNLDV